eukprot:gene4220-5284_t
MSTNSEVTICVAENDFFFQVPIDLNQPLGDLKKAIEFQTAVPISDQVILLNGKPITNIDTDSLTKSGINHGELLYLVKKQMIQQQQQQQQQQQRSNTSGSLQQQQPRSNQVRQQQQQQQDITSLSPKQVIEYFTNNPEQLTNLINSAPGLADAILNNKEETIGNWLDHLKEKKKQQELFERAERDPFDMEAQKAIYEYIQKQNIDNAFEFATEHTPEIFGRVIMLYIDCSINGVPIKAFVDTGAQQSTMFAKCAERCGLMRFVDTRFKGIARGVGSAQILGQVHAASLKIGKSHFNISLSVLSGDGQHATEFILGLDMLKRHQCQINLAKGTLSIGSEEVEFLHEKDLKEILSNDVIPENYIPPSSTTTSSTTSPPTTTSTTTSSTSSPPTPTPTISKPQPTIATIPPSPTSTVSKPQPTTTATSPPPQQSTTTSTDPNLETKIQALISLGCPRAQAITLLNRAGGDADRAASMFFGM